jgi:beta-glucanase (GH16 family)
VVHGTIHGYSGVGGITASLDTGSPLADDFHVYAVSRELDRIRWYADHTLYPAVTPAGLQGKPWVFDHGFYLLINVAIGGRFSAPPDRQPLSRRPCWLITSAFTERRYTPPSAQKLTVHARHDHD